MSAISGTRRAIKELADGTVRVQIDVDAEHRRRFFELFPDIDMPVALAPLMGDFEQPAQEKPKPAPLGPCALLAVRWCKEKWFFEWCAEMWPPAHPMKEADCRTLILDMCGVESRRDLDTDDEARETFHNTFRQPFMAWLKAHGREIL